MLDAVDSNFEFQIGEAGVRFDGCKCGRNIRRLGVRYESLNDAVGGGFLENCFDRGQGFGTAGEEGDSKVAM